MAAAQEGLARYYGAEWRNGQQKKVEVIYRISRSHLQLEYEFSGEEGGYTWGDVIVWRNRFGELWYHVRPHG